jgi:hypothetical protein
MKKGNKHFAIQATTKDGDKYLCWEVDKHIYFASKDEGYAIPPPPILFSSEKEANEALDRIPPTEGNLSQFEELIESELVEVVSVTISVQ